jgi:hypothetical protein
MGSAAAGAAPMRRLLTTVDGGWGRWGCCGATGCGGAGRAAPRSAATSGGGAGLLAGFWPITRIFSVNGPQAISSTARTSQALTLWPLTKVRPLPPS